MNAIALGNDENIGNKSDLLLRMMFDPDSSCLFAGDFGADRSSKTARSEKRKHNTNELLRVLLDYRLIWGTYDNWIANFNRAQPSDLQ